MLAQSRSEDFSQKRKNYFIWDQAEVVMSQDLNGDRSGIRIFYKNTGAYFVDSKRIHVKYLVDPKSGLISFLMAYPYTNDVNCKWDLGFLKNHFVSAHLKNLRTELEREDHSFKSICRSTQCGRTCHRTGTVARHDIIVAFTFIKLKLVGFIQILSNSNHQLDCGY